MSKSHKSNSLAEISTIFGMTLLLTLFGVFVYFMLTANKKSAEIKEQLSMDILFHENVDESTVKMMEKKLKSMDGIVRNALYVSKEDAQKLMMKHVGEDAFEILDGVNPLPSSIHVNLTSSYVNPDSAHNFSSLIYKGNEHIISEVAYNESQFLEIGNVFKNFELIMIFIASVLLVIAILLIYNTIRLAVFSKRFMIRTMQLVGATRSFIRVPFIKTNLLLSLISSTIAIVSILILIDFFDSNIDFYNYVELNSIFLLLSSVVVLGFIISIVSTFFATQNILNIDTKKLDI